MGKGGVVRVGEDRREALIAVGAFAIELGAALVGFYSSGLPGPKGNRETFAWLTASSPQGDPSRDRGSRDPAALSRMAHEVEP